MCSERGAQVIMSETDGVGASKFKTNAELCIIEKESGKIFKAKLGLTLEARAKDKHAAPELWSSSELLNVRWIHCFNKCF